MEAQIHPTLHDDYLHDVAYDYYGRRLATCGSDQRIKIWSVAEDGAWTPVASFKAHYGPVNRLSWAHPEFGTLLASCSSDHNVLIWEEQEGVDDAGRVVSRWHKRAQLGDARDAVNAVAFAPRHLGLKLAAGSSDGSVRVYEAGDLVSLAHWEFAHEFHNEQGASSGAGAGAGASAAGGATASGQPHGGGVSCLSWCTSPFDAAMMVVGGSSPIVRVWGFSAAARKWLPMLELTGHSMTPPPGIFGAPSLVGGLVCDVSWAPNIGRSYHLVASAGKDGRLCMWRIQPESTADAAGTAASAPSSAPGSTVTSGTYTAGSVSANALGTSNGAGTAQSTANEQGPADAANPASGSTGTVAAVRKLPGSSADAAHVATFIDHCGQPVWRADWNVTGTVLASSGDDGTLRMRKQTMGGRWELVSTVHSREALQTEHEGGSGSGQADPGQ